MQKEIVLTHLAMDCEKKFYNNFEVINIVEHVLVVTAIYTYSSNVG